MYYVYFLRCNDNKTYIGCTGDLKARLERHNKRQISATKDRIPVKLENYFAFSDKYLAYNFEKYLKSGSGRAFLKKTSRPGIIQPERLRPQGLRRFNGERAGR